MAAHLLRMPAATNGGRLKNTDTGFAGVFRRPLGFDRLTDDRQTVIFCSGSRGFRAAAKLLRSVQQVLLPPELLFSSASSTV